MLVVYFRGAPLRVGLRKRKLLTRLEDTLPKKEPSLLNVSNVDVVYRVLLAAFLLGEPSAFPQDEVLDLEEEF
jgi:hypothetical protein